MPARKKSRSFTTLSPGPFGPPLLGALLRIPWETVRRRMLDRLKDHGFDDFEAPQLILFLFPGPEGAKPSELAGRLGVSKQSVNYLLGQLERSGYLERRDDLDDMRSRRIHLTERGKEVGRAMREAVQEVEREWEARLGSKRLNLLRDLLQELSR